MKYARRVVITGMGTVNPLGHNVEDTWSAMMEGKLAPSVNELFDASTFPTKFAAQVKDFDLAGHIPADVAAGHSTAGRHCQFALGAAWEAWQQSGLAQFDELDKTRTGVYLGSGEGSLDFENYIGCLVDAFNTEERSLDTDVWPVLAEERMDLHREVEQESNMVVSHLASMLGVTGPAFNVLTACAASTQAIGEAVMQIRYGWADTIVTGGAHSMIHPLGVTGFNRLTALSQRNDDIATASRPFDLTRDGFVLGEGASILILETYEQAVARGATILGEIVGYGASADAYRITDQDPEGMGAAASMAAALNDADLAPKDIDYISAHGTATKQNDKIETKAIKVAFGEEAPNTPISSAKSMIGHLIAAAGATELITCLLAIRDQILPPTANMQEADPECDLDYIPNAPRKADVTRCMSNSMGFGGQNNTLIVSKCDS
ncbi:MAG: beta-ketoacyl-[acyl-carrier-protein] synthase family protein [Phycisphaerales bacterium]|jgi:3-oxoacyl-[acyl-carrier-protein] synthase II|nr:beta-ketoacyl-[acyl-carrier-protein] synthase family protein [Phycisphaerales bacterium]MBT7171178.1 beta-ketoacyl-[acyl-carrier-protein] synthase family protein [Phycisphaerales bacterium]